MSSNPIQPTLDLVPPDADRDEDWEYGICYVDTFTGRKSFERNYAGDPRSYELAVARLAELSRGGTHWRDSTVARRRRTEWEQMPQRPTDRSVHEGTRE